jgi:hypothetical protein
MAYRRWLSTLAFEHPAQQIVFQDYVDAVMDAERRLNGAISGECGFCSLFFCRQFLSPTSPIGRLNH